jgi:cell division protein FtsW (lipid II flippase)
MLDATVVIFFVVIVLLMVPFLVCLFAGSIKVTTLLILFFGGLALVLNVVAPGAAHIVENWETVGVDPMFWSGVVAPVVIAFLAWLALRSRPDRTSASDRRN